VSVSVKTCIEIHCFIGSVRQIVQETFEIDQETETTCVTSGGSGGCRQSSELV
jgi:hypothetical protein